MYICACMYVLRLIDCLLISSFSCSQYGRTAVLLAAVEGHLDLVRELVEQHRADLLHKSNVSSTSFCVWFRL